MLSCKYNSTVSSDLYLFVLDEILNIYSSFGGPWELAASENMKARIVRITSGENILDKKYYRAVTDFEFFTLAIMCDLLAIEKYTEIQSPATSTLEEASKLVLSLFKSETSFLPDGGWVFQSGAWSDHPSYEYAGNTDIKSGLQVSIVEDIGMDSSHFHRLPLQIRSFMHSQQNAEGYQFFSKLLSGLNTQLVTRVLEPPTSEIPFFRMNNFMSGHNGVYRYSYHVSGEGYGPYQLSRTFLLGWWSFLGTDDVSKAYSSINSYFPLNEFSNVIYSDPVTVREQNVMYSTRSEESKKLLELICSLASKIR